MALTLSGQIQFNRGGHPYVVVTEAEDALRVLEGFSGKNRIGSSPSGARTFHTPVVVLIGGVEQVALGIGARFYEEETTRERNPRNGKIRVTTTRIEGSGTRYVYLQESASVGPRVREERRGDPDDMDQWAQWPSDGGALPRGIDQ